MPGDVLIAVPSAGLHTNGYSLARRVFFELAGWKPDTFVRELGATIGEALLAPHRSYLPAIRPLLERDVIKGMAHITGGGITENLPRVLPEGCAASIDLTRAWTVPPIFHLLQQHGAIARDEMFRAFNMGVGLIVVCAASEAGRVVGQLEAAGEPGAVVIGFEVTPASVRCATRKGAGTLFHFLPLTSDEMRRARTALPAPPPSRSDQLGGARLPDLVPIRPPRSMAANLANFSCCLGH